MYRIGSLRASGRVFICALLVVCAGAWQIARAQDDKAKREKRPGVESRSSTMRVELGQPVAETPVPMVGGRPGVVGMTNSLVMPDVSFDRAVVKGAPFSAESTTEHFQTLADGNRIGRKSTARLYRDSAGRTRREHVMDSRRGTAPDGDEPRLIVINDPVANVNYTAETLSKTVRKVSVPPGLAEARARAMGGAGAPDSSFGVLMPTSAAHRRAAEGDAAPPMPEPKRERLEAQTIEGVVCEGTRTTVTIPAGEFDNERPIEITHEQWYSPELRMVVLLKHNDPRFGETVFRLTNVVRGEQDRALFEPPQGYRTIDGRESLFPMRPAGRPLNER
jgi:hypothetical protein